MSYKNIKSALQLAGDLLFINYFIEYFKPYKSVERDDVFDFSFPVAKRVKRYDDLKQITDYLLLFDIEDIYSLNADQNKNMIYYGHNSKQECQKFAYSGSFYYLIDKNKNPLLHDLFQFVEGFFAVIFGLANSTLGLFVVMPLHDLTNNCKYLFNSNNGINLFKKLLNISGITIARLFTRSILLALNLLQVCRGIMQIITWPLFLVKMPFRAGITVIDNLFTSLYNHLVAKSTSSCSKRKYKSLSVAQQNLLKDMVNLSLTSKKLNTMVQTTLNLPQEQEDDVDVDEDSLPPLVQAPLNSTQEEQINLPQKNLIEAKSANFCGGISNKYRFDGALFCSHIMPFVYKHKENIDLRRLREMQDFHKNNKKHHFKIFCRHCRDKYLNKAADIFCGGRC